MEVEFVDNLPEYSGDGLRGLAGRMAAFGRELAEQPGRWAKWPWSAKYSSLRNSASRINTGKTASLPGEQFEARVHEGALYVRFKKGTKS